MYSSIIFFITSVIIMICAFVTIKAENIFCSLLSAMGVFLGVAVLFYLLGSEYNAIIQVLIYGFAVPVILAVGMMFTTLKNEKNIKLTNKSYLLILTGCIFILGLTYLVMTSFAIIPDSFNMVENTVTHGNNLSIFAKGIFVKYVFAFELISLILTIIAAGLTIFKKGNKLKPSENKGGEKL